MNQRFGVVGKGEAAAVEGETVQFDKLDVFGGQKTAITGKDETGCAGDFENSRAGGEDDIGDNVASGLQEDRSILVRRILQKRLQEAALIVGRAGLDSARIGVDGAAERRRFGRARRGR